MANSANVKQSLKKGAVRTTREVASFGDKSNNFKSYEETFINGNQKIVSDNITKEVIQTDKVSIVKANNIIETDGNDSNWTNELNEGAYGSRMRIIGNPEVINKGLHKDAETLKNEIIAARSGFNDDRNELNFNILDGFMSMPTEVLNAITSIPEDVADGDDMPLSSGGTNLFIDMAMDVANEIGNYMKKFSKITASSLLEKAKLAAKNNIEKQTKQISEIAKLPESINKEKLKKAIEEGNISTLLSDPSNEKKDKKSFYNKDEYEAKVAELTPQIIELEKQCC